MNRKAYTIIGIAALLIIAGTVSIAMQAKPKGIRATAICATKDDSPNLKISSYDENNISMAVTGSITNVPAGTNVNINLISYNGSVAAGSAIYDGTYGSYNFTAKKDKSVPAPSNRINWVIMSFTPCKR